MKAERKDEDIEESWNKKRVGVAVVILMGIIASLFYLLNNNFHFYKPQDAKVLSAKDVKLEDVVQNQIMNLKKEALSLNVEEIASSSPQVRKLVDDLKALGDLPKNQVKGACFKICDGL
ncbi:MAG: hypothetical protein AAB521_00060 [Patescibacteria group bacterium]